MVSAQVSKSLCGGKWVGTSVNRPYNDFTEIEIFEKDGVLYLRRREDIGVVLQEGQIYWDSPSHFHAEVPHWTKSVVKVEGTIYGDGDQMSLEVKFRNDGITGLEEMTVILTRAGENVKKFLRAGECGSANLSLRNNVFERGKPSDINMSQEEVDAAVHKMLLPTSAHPDHRLDALLLLKDGKTIIEEYFWGMDAQTPHQIASITKSVVGILCGIAWDQGKFGLDDMVSEAFPDSKSTWAEDKPIRVRHLLSMTSGIKFGNTETQSLLTSECVEDLVLSSQRIGVPGEKYRYDNGSTAMLALFLEKKTGMGLRAFGEKYLFGPMGITDYRWLRMRQRSIDGEPFVLTSGGMYMTVPDCAKLGQMMLDEGTYQGLRILSADYVHLCTQQQNPDGQYPFGFLWHLNTDLRHFARFNDAFIAIGTGEQTLCVIPSKKIVFVAACSSWHSRSPTPVILSTFGETILNHRIWRGSM